MIPCKGSWHLTCSEKRSWATEGGSGSPTGCATPTPHAQPLRPARQEGRQGSPGGLWPHRRPVRDLPGRPARRHPPRSRPRARRRARPPWPSGTHRVGSLPPRDLRACAERCRDPSLPWQALRLLGGARAQDARSQQETQGEAAAPRAAHRAFPVAHRCVRVGADDAQAGDKARARLAAGGLLLRR